MSDARAQGRLDLDAATIAAVLDVLPDPAIVLDEEMRCVAFNRRAVEATGKTAGDLGAEAAATLVHPDDIPHVLSSFEEVLTKDVGTPIEVRVRSADGTWRLAEAVGSTFRHAGGVWLISTFRDLTERRRWEFSATDTDRFRVIVESSALVVLLCDAEGRIESVSGAMCRHLGHDPSRVIGTRLGDWVVEHDRAAFDAAFADAVVHPGVHVIETRLRHKDGRDVAFQLSVSNLLDDPVAAGVIVSGQDITRRRALEDHLSRLATRDALTGLANRTQLEMFLDAKVHDGDDEPVGVMFVDLDRFKRVNDLYGHPTGDALLVQIADRLVTLVRPGDLVARYGGDEFVIVCPGADPDSTIPSMVERIERELAKPIEIGDLTLTIDASVGSVTARGETSAEVLLAEADDVMYAAKDARDSDGEVLRRLTIAERRGLADDLRAALDHGPESAGLGLHFQPIVALSTGEVVGAEALVRWRHPTLGRLGPDQFLPVAEDAGLAGRLGVWVLGGALDQVVAWDRTGEHVGVVVSVNLGAGEAADATLETNVLAALAERGLTPGRLCLEVTEPLLGGGGRRRRPAPSAIQALAGRGVVVAIDDFGTGFPSLHALRDYPAAVLKIDRSVVADVATDDAARGVCAAVVALARTVGKVTVAEGVESADQAAVLARLGVDQAQGHHFGRPEPATD